MKLRQKPNASNQQLRIRSSIPICSSDSDSTKLGQNPSAPYQNSEARSSSGDETRSSKMLVATKLLKDRLDPKTFHYYPSFFSFRSLELLSANLFFCLSLHHDSNGVSKYSSSSFIPSYCSSISGKHHIDQA